MVSRLHYLHDPLCGWCWAASPLIQAARELLPVQALDVSRYLGRVEARQQWLQAQLASAAVG